MKKLFALLLAAVMCASMLTACGSGETRQSPSPAPAGSNEPGGSAGNEEEGFDTVTLTGVTAFSTNDADGKVVEHFGQVLEELTGGAVTVNIHYSGSFCDITEEFDYVMAGDVDFAMPKPVYGISFIPLAYGLSSSVNSQDALDKANYLTMEHPELAPLAMQQCRDNNLEFLGHSVLGASAFLSDADISQWENVTKLTIGSPISLDAYAAMGCGTALVEPPAMYESLSRGVCDAIAFSTGDMLGAKLYEAGKNLGDQRSYVTSGIFVMNLEKFNSLNAKTQEAIREAALQTCQWSVDNSNAEYEQLKEVIEGNGGTWTVYSEEDTRQFHQLLWDSDNALFRQFGANLGCEDAIEIMVQARAEALGYEYVAP